jgi:hypothetical protein
VTSKRLPSQVVRQIRNLRAQGWSYARISEHVGVSTTTCQAYAPGGQTKRLPRNSDEDAFTQEMLEVGREIVARLEREGRLPPV